MPNPRLTETLSWPQICQKIMNESNDHSKRFGEWLMGKESLKGYFFNSRLWKKCFNIKESLRRDDRDHFIVVTGKEGSGKSTLAMQMCCVIDPSFQLKNICFKPGQFIEGIRRAKQGEAFLLDEGNLFLFSREAMSSDNKFMLKLFALMRQKNLCVFIAVPNFFTIDSYIRDHRTETLIWVNKKANYRLFVKKAIRIISKEGSKFKQIAGIWVPDENKMMGYFNRFLPTLNDISETSYKQYKGENFIDFLDDLERAIKSKETKSKFVTVRDAMKVIPVSDDTIRNMIKNKKLKGRKIGGNWFVERDSLKEIAKI